MWKVIKINKNKLKELYFNKKMTYKEIANKLNCSASTVSTYMKKYGFKARHQKIPYKTIKEGFEKEGCELLSKEIKNTKSKVKYKCSCGNIAWTTWHNFRKGHKCNKCGTKRGADKNRLSYKEVSKVFEDGGCELLAKEYKNSDTKMKYRCSCGNISYINLYNFKQGKRCRKCYIESIKGEGHPNYKKERPKETRVKERQIKGYKQWIEKVYKRDNYTCQKCGEIGGSLNAHHLNSYADFPKQRTKLENGITLCEDCHQKFHKEYGFKHNIESEFKQFLKGGE